MPNFQQHLIPVNRGTLSFLPVLALCAAMLFSLAGCEGVGGVGGTSRETTTGTQSMRVIEGTAYLSPGDPLTSHAGILVYLAGTGHQARTDRSGRYRIDNVPTGVYEMVAERTGFRMENFDTIAVDAGASGGAPLRPKIPFLQLQDAMAGTTLTESGVRSLGSLSGVVMLQGAGEYSGVRVQVDGTAIVTASDENGRYRIVNLDAGTYRLLFSKPGFRSTSVDEVTVRANLNTDVADQALERAVPAVTDRTIDETDLTTAAAAPLTATGGDRVISGIVTLTNAESQPVTDFSQVIVAINDTELIATPDAEGRFEYVNLAPNVYTLLTSFDGGEPVRTLVDVRTQPTASVTIRLSTAPAQVGVGVVRGRFLLPGLDNLPLADATGVRASIAGTQMSAFTAADGTFEMRDVPVGTYTVTAAKEGFEDFTQEGVVVVAGQTTELGDLAMEPKRDYPRVIGTSPASGTTNVPVNLDLVLQVRFSKKMDVASVRDALSINPPVAAQILMGKGTHPMADDDNLVVVISNMNDQVPIKFNTTYRVTVAETASDIEGLGMREAFTMTFTTGAPGLIATQPANGARDVYLDQLNMPVILNFNTRLDPDTVNDRSIRVRPDNGISVRVMWVNDPQTGWTNVQVATQWQQDTQYTITIGRDVRAYNGQPLGNTPYVLRFRTGVLQVLQVPVQVVR